MILLNVLDESWVIELCGGVAAGWQITVGQIILLIV